MRHLLYKNIFRLYEFIQPYLKYSLPVEEKLPYKKVLVIAPHQDDESIGCGGTLYRHTTQSDNIAEVIFLTYENEQRKKEAVMATKVLGINKITFFNYKQETLPKYKNDLIERFLRIFDEKKPEILFIPFIIDNHVDHITINQVLVGVSDIKKFDFLIYSYPVWFPVYPNVLIDISSVWEKKKEAISCYRSQLAMRNYIEMSYSLGRYWANVKGGKLENVETFFRATFNEYIKLCKKIF